MLCLSVSKLSRSWICCQTGTAQERRDKLEITTNPKISGRCFAEDGNNVHLLFLVFIFNSYKLNCKCTSEINFFFSEVPVAIVVIQRPDGTSLIPTAPLLHSRPPPCHPSKCSRDIFGACVFFRFPPRRKEKETLTGLFTPLNHINVMWQSAFQYPKIPGSLF